MAEIVVPDLAFTGFYYPELLQASLAFMRVNVPDITDESEFEAAIQMLRAFSLMGHNSNTNLDVSANELTIQTLRLRDSAQRLLNLVGVYLKSATPATVEVQLKLSKVITSDTTGYVPALTEFATRGSGSISFEALASLDLDRTDRVYRVYAQEIGASGSDGSVSSSAPNRFNSATGAFTGADLGSEIHVTSSSLGNNGEYTIAAIISSTEVEVSGANFVTESSLAWKKMVWSVDFSTNANTGGDFFTPIATPAIGELLYVAHRHVQWDKMNVDVSTPGDKVVGVWEYFDDELGHAAPDAVTDLGGTINFAIDSLIGGSFLVPAPNSAGALVRVEYAPTGAWEERVSTYGLHAGPPSASRNQITTVGLLGQTTVSTNPNDYIVSAKWLTFPGLVDGTRAAGESFEVDGDVTYSLPQGLTRSWRKKTVNGVEAYWARFRIVTATAAVAFILDRIRIDTGNQYFLLEVTQGKTVGPQVIGSSSGLADQSFSIPQTPFLDGSETIEVNEGGGFAAWARVLDFVRSSTSDKHYRVTVDSKGQGTIRFGDGTNGKIPATGTDNVRATYRVGGEEDGNVGADTVQVNSDGVPFVQELTNPRQGVGWAAAEGSTAADLERVKVSGPAQLRVRDLGIRYTDVQVLAVGFTTEAGSKPVARAFALEEEFGLKTIGVLVVGSGGALLSASDREELETFLNGDKFAVPPVEPRIASNHEASVINYTPQGITVTLTVTWAGGSAAAVKAALVALLNPLSLEEDGASFVWSPGGLVARSRIIHAVHSIDDQIKNVSLTAPASDVSLGPRSLPNVPASSITVTIVEP